MRSSIFIIYIKYITIRMRARGEIVVAIIFVTVQKWLLGVIR